MAQVFRVERNKNFTVMSNHHFKNKDLSLKAKGHIAAGLPLTWVVTQKEDFQRYLLQNESVDFIFRNKEYHVEFAGADIYPQGFAAAFYRLQDFKGINMLVDIGNGTMNIMYINNSRPLENTY